MDGIKPPEETEEETAPQTEQEEPGASPKSSTDKKNESKLHGMQIILLFGAALLIDGAQLILTAFIGIFPFLAPIFIAANYAISGIAWLGFFLWLHSLGIGMMKKEKIVQSLLNSPLATTSITAAIEFIVGALPAWTLMVVITVIRDRAETIIAAASGLDKIASGVKKIAEVKKSEPTSSNASQDQKSETYSDNLSRQTVQNESRVNFDRDEGEKLRRMRESKTPEWMQDKRAKEAGNLRNERFAAAQSMGMDKSEAAKKILDLEKGA